MTTLTPNRCAYGMMAVSGTANKTTVLLNTGNYPSYSSYLNTTLTFPGSGTPNWTQVSASSIDPSGPLPTRVDAVMSWDGYNVMLYGGRESSSLGGVLEDTWALASAATWSQLSPATVPFGRYKAEGSYLAGTGVVMFGGTIANGQLIDETWTWNGSAQTWTQLTSTNNATTWPAARVNHMMASNGTNVVMFGGKGNNSLYNDAWSFASGAWTLLTPTTPPSVRSDACMVSDGTNYILFGGTDEYNYKDEVWALNSAGTAWKQLTPTGVMPSGRVGAQMVWDSTLTAAVLFGGVSASSNYPDNSTYKMTYNLSAGTCTWTQL